MGQVYRAHDSRLNRDVALKVLPEAFALDPDRLARFKREAQVLASLNHPNVAAIHGFEESGGVQALVLELVDGPTLADRIAQGPIPLDEALPIARQLAEALEAAHEQGVIHRDLKPANIKLRPDGMVKVLDFGVAKAFEGDPIAAGAALASMSPTITSPAATRIGVILGTAAYMSPEQARGKVVDKRTDVWAFGCVLYEMLTGKRPFEGEEITDVLARVLEREPQLAALPPLTPLPIRRLLRRCLEKTPRERLPHIGAARLEIKDAQSGIETAAAPARAQTRDPPHFGRFIVATGLLVFAAVGLTRWLATDESGQPLWLSILPAQGTFDDVPSCTRTSTSFGPAPALSADGHQIAFCAPDATGVGALWIRSFESPTPRMLDGTQGANLPFWSPDSQSIGFFAGGKLKRMSVTGGSPQTLADAVGPRGGTWGRNGDIVFMPATGAQGLYRVAAAGGPVTQVTRLSANRQEVEHLYPYFLPDGRRFLFFAGSLDDRYTGLYGGTLDGAEPTLIASMQSRAEYGNGHLIFGRGTDLFAQPFDVDAMRLEGEPIRIAEQVGTAYGSFQNYAFSATNMAIAFWSGSTTPRRQLVHADATGRFVRNLGDPDLWINITLSPDGTRAALERLDEEEKSGDIWIMDLATASLSRFTSHVGPWRWFGGPVWSRNDALILATNFTGAFWVKSVRRSDEAGQRLKRKLDGNGGWPTDWSPDQRYVVAGQNDTETGGDIWILPTNDEAPFPYQKTPFTEQNGRFSPDGRWIAWTSNESGRDEVYVDTFPEPSGKTLVSRGGGNHARWRRDGRILYYISAGGNLTATLVASDGKQVKASTPTALFRLPRMPDLSNRSPYEVVDKNQGFVLITEVDNVQAKGIAIVMNWSGLLKP